MRPDRTRPSIDRMICSCFATHTTTPSPPNTRGDRLYPNNRPVETPAPTASGYRGLMPRMLVFAVAWLYFRMWASSPSYGPWDKTNALTCWTRTAFEGLISLPGVSKRVLRAATSGAAHLGTCPMLSATARRIDMALSFASTPRTGRAALL